MFAKLGRTSGQPRCRHEESPFVDQGAGGSAGQTLEDFRLVKRGVGSQETREERAKNRQVFCFVADSPGEAGGVGSNLVGVKLRLVRKPPRLGFVMSDSPSGSSVALSWACKSRLIQSRDWFQFVTACRDFKFQIRTANFERWLSVMSHPIHVICC